MGAYWPVELEHAWTLDVKTPSKVSSAVHPLSAAIQTNYFGPWQKRCIPVSEFRPVRLRRSIVSLGTLVHEPRRVLPGHLRSGLHPLDDIHAMTELS